MNKSVWKKLRHFSPKEKWGDPDKMNPALLLLTDEVRDRVGKKFIIHCGYETTGHQPHSQHYLANAIDFHVEGLSFLDAYYAIKFHLNKIPFIGGMASNYVGFGIYPEWNNPGFHLDLRGYKARWGMVGGKYVSINNALERAKQLFRG